MANVEDLEEIQKELEGLDIDDDETDGEFQIPTLYPHQVEHANKLCLTLEKLRRAGEWSPLGAGKTHVISYIAHKYNRPLFIIGPNSARDIWREAIEELYNLPRVTGRTHSYFINYESFRATGKHQPKHGLLFKEGDTYYGTELLDDLVKQDCIIVFDEAQSLKNTGTTTDACLTLIKRVLHHNDNKSWIIYTSGSIMDDIKQITNFMKVFGIMKEDELYTNRFGTLTLTGITEIQDFAIYLNQGNRRFLEWYEMNPFIAKPKNAKEYVLNLFNYFIKPYITSTMPKAMFDSKLDIKNGFYKLDRRDEIRYVEAIRGLKAQVNFDATGEGVNLQQGDILKVGAYLKHIQMAKVNAMIRVVKRDLRRSYYYNGELCRRKIVIFADFHDVINAIAEGLEEYGCLIYTGRVKVDKRHEAIRKFNEPNDNYRVLILNTACGGKSINPIDRDGRFRRSEYLMPTYMINNLHQASMRTYRLGMVGDTDVRFFYGKTSDGVTELSILDALARKGKIMSMIHKEQGVKFPGEYENEYEDDMDVEEETEALVKV